MSLRDLSGPHVRLYQLRKWEDNAEPKIVLPVWKIRL